MYGLGIVPGVGAEDFGPPAPTVVQQAGQVVTDVTGINVKTLMMYGGIALLGYYWYTASGE